MRKLNPFEWIWFGFLWILQKLFPVFTYKGTVDKQISMYKEMKDQGMEEQDILNRIIMSRIKVSFGDQESAYNAYGYLLDQNRKTLEDVVRHIIRYEYFYDESSELNIEEYQLDNNFIGKQEKECMNYIDKALKEKGIRNFQYKNRAFQYKNYIGPQDSSLRDFPLLFLYFDYFSEIDDAEKDEFILVAVYDQKHPLGDVLKNEKLFLKLYEDKLLRIKINEEMLLCREDEEYYLKDPELPSDIEDRFNKIKEKSLEMLNYAVEEEKKALTIRKAIKVRYGY